MNISLFMDVLLLFSLGICGWVLFRTFHVPVPALLGTIAVIGTLRALSFSLPLPHGFLYPLVQLMLGLFVGSRVTRDASRQFKGMLVPVVIIIVWAITILFALGLFLSRITFLDPYTAILSSSVAGLPEMTVIAMATTADVTVVVIFQTFRLIITVITFPLIFRYWVIRNSPQVKFSNMEKNLGLFLSLKQKINKVMNFKVNFRNININRFKILLIYMKNKEISNSLKQGLFTLVIAAMGGVLFSHFGIPAGAMVGAMIFVAGASLLGVNIKTPPPLVFVLIHIGIGIQVSSNISSKIVEALVSGKLFIPILIVTLIIFISSFFIAYIISKTVKWDFPTCFLAAAPAGFSVMTALAVDFEKNPLKVSMLHLCRLLAVKTIIPFVFMFLFK